MNGKKSKLAKKAAELLYNSLAKDNPLKKLGVRGIYQTIKRGNR